MKYLAAFLLGPLLALVAAAVWFAMNFTVIAAIQGEEWIVVRKERTVDCEMQGGCIVFSPTELMRALARFAAGTKPPSPRSQDAPL